MSAPAESGSLSETLRRIRDAVGLQPFDVSLQQLMDSCVALLDVSGAGVMLIGDSPDLRYAVTSGSHGRQLQEAQFAVSCGPCMSAYATAEATASSDVQTDQRWPQLATELARSQVRAVLSMPVRIAGLAVGSVHLYQERPHEWTNTEHADLDHVAALLDSVLGTAIAADYSAALAAQLQQALDRRSSIERGIGYLMARDHTTSAAAFHAIRSTARSRRRALSDITDLLLQTGQLPPPHISDRR